MGTRHIISFVFYAQFFCADALPIQSRTSDHSHRNALSYAHFYAVGDPIHRRRSDGSLLRCSGTLRSSTQLLTRLLDLARSSPGVSICTFVLVKQVN
jgi:hypothetical protein